MAAPIGIILASHVLRLMSPSFRACVGEPTFFVLVSVFRLDSIQNLKLIFTKLIVIARPVLRWGRPLPFQCGS